MDTLPRASSFLKINQGYTRCNESSKIDERDNWINHVSYEFLKNSKITPTLLLWLRYDTLSQIITLQGFYSLNAKSTAVK